MGNKLFFSNKKVSKGPQLSAEDVKVHFEQRFCLCKETSALVNLLFISMNGKSCEKKKEESMPMNLPEISENDGTTVKYHDYTNTKNSCSIAVAFVASKLFFFADRSCFFSATVLTPVLSLLLITNQTSPLTSEINIFTNYLETSYLG
jgi:hypothetical protein